MILARTTCARSVSGSLHQDHLCKISASGSLHQNPARHVKTRNFASVRWTRTILAKGSSFENMFQKHWACHEVMTWNRIRNVALATQNHPQFQVPKMQPFSGIEPLKTQHPWYEFPAPAAGECNPSNFK